MAKKTNLGVAYLAILPEMSGVFKGVEKHLKGITSKGKKVAKNTGNEMEKGISSGVSRGVGSGLKSGFKGIGKLGASAGKTLAKTMAGTFAVGAGAIGAALGASVTKGIGRLTSIDQAEAKLSGLGHSADTVADIMKNANAAVKGTAFGLDEAASVAAGAVAANIKPGQQLEKTLKLIGDASTIAGTDLSSMGAIFNKVATSDMMQMDVANQLMDSGIPIIQLVAKELGVTAAEARKMASDGKVSFETFQKAIESGMGGAALKSGATVSGAYKNMTAAAGRFGATLAGPGFQNAPAIFTALTSAFDQLNELMKPVSDEIADRMGPGVEKLADYIGTRLVPDLVTMGKKITETFGVVSGHVSTAKTTVEGLVVSVRDFLPEGSAGKAIGWLSAGFAAALTTIQELEPVFMRLWTASQPHIQTVWGVLQQIGGELTGIFAAFMGSTAGTGELLPQLLQQIFSSLAEILPQLISNFQTILPSLITIFGELGKGLAEVSGAMWMTALETAIAFLPVAMQLLQDFSNFLRDVVSPALQGIAGFLSENEWAAQALVGAFLGFKGLGMAIGLLTTVGATLAKLGTIFGSLFGKVKMVVSVVKILGGVFLTPPLGIAVAIGAVIAGLVIFFTKTETGRELLQKFIDKIKDFGSWISGLGSRLKEGFGNFLDWIGKKWGQFEDFLLSPFKKLQEQLEKIPGIGGFFKNENIPSNSARKFTEAGYNKGGVLPGYSPGRDIHRYTSPTAPPINLGGGESIMVTEFAKAVGGERVINELNSRARRNQPFMVASRNGHFGGDNTGSIIEIKVGSDFISVSDLQRILSQLHLHGQQIKIIQDSQGSSALTSYLARK